MNNMDCLKVKTEPVSEDIRDTEILSRLNKDNPNVESETGLQSVNIPVNCFDSIFGAQYPKWETVLIKTEPGLDADDSVSNAQWSNISNSTKQSHPSTGYRIEYPKSKISHNFIYKVEQVFDKSSSRERLKCPCCYFLTDNRGNLTQHMKIHQRPKGGAIYVCEFCDFSTKYKNSIKGHVLRHKVLKQNKIKRGRKKKFL